MKIQFIKDEAQPQDTLTIKYSEDSVMLNKIKAYLENLNKEFSKIELFKEDTKYYIEVDKILFFETESSKIVAHTVDDMYAAKYKLYELEDILSNNFIRVSKSAIVNVSHIFSIDRNVTSSSCIKFNGTYKNVYVSRRYYKDLKNKLNEMRNGK